MPTGSDEVVYVAIPPLILPDPSVVLPFENVTIPVAYDTAEAVRVAVNVTVCPTLAGFADAVSVVVVVACAIVINRDADILLERFEETLPSP